LLFEQAAQELLPHAGHKVSIISEGGDTAPEAVGVICEDCQTVLLDFARSERPDADRVKYEAHYDAGRDVCYVEVFKPGKSPYPLQERQDIVNHSLTGIAWGYGGSGPAAQCAFAILMDYLGVEEQARQLYQQFKFAVIARLEPNSEWMLGAKAWMRGANS
jgi:hypothetical protein